MMLGSTFPLSTSAGYHYSTGSFDQEVIADSTGRIVAGDPGQMTIRQWLSANPNALVLPQVSTTYDGPLAPNYAAYVALAIAAFFVIKGLSK